MVTTFTSNSIMFPRTDLKNDQAHHHGSNDPSPDGTILERNLTLVDLNQIDPGPDRKTDLERGAV